VVVLEVHIDRVTGIEAKRHSQVSGHIDCIRSPAIALQLVKAESRKAHVLRPIACVKAVQDAPKAHCLTAIDSASVVLAEVSPEPLVPNERIMRAV
jgi:hypothetical protein